LGTLGCYGAEVMLGKEIPPPTPGRKGTSRPAPVPRKGDPGGARPSLRTGQTDRRTDRVRVTNRSAGRTRV
jgi:hypothetical protein